MNRLSWVLVLILTGVAAAFPASAQILNALGGFADETEGLAGEAQVTFSVTGGNTEVLSLAAHGRLQYQTGRERIRILGGASRKTSRGEEIAESTVFHLRHNHRFRPWFHSLVFGQLQKNPFQRLRSRLLLGVGARFDALRGETWRLSVGAAHMVEIERVDAVAGSDTDQRLSSFVVLEGALNERVGLEATAFVQPLWDEPDDLRALALGGLRVRLAGELSLTTTVNYQYDARPPVGVERTDWDLNTGLSYSF